MAKSATPASAATFRPPRAAAQVHALRHEDAGERQERQRVAHADVQARADRGGGEERRADSRRARAVRKATSATRRARRSTAAMTATTASTWKPSGVFSAKATGRSTTSRRRDARPGGTPCGSARAPSSTLRESLHVIGETPVAGVDEYQRCVAHQREYAAGAQHGDAPPAIAAPRDRLEHDEHARDRQHDEARCT
jgi:hypothetical protein